MFVNTNPMYKKCQHKKIPLKYTLILSSLSIYLFFFFKEMTQLSISRIWMFSMRSCLFPNRPHWLLLSLLFTHVSMMYICLWYYLINSTYLSCTLFFNRYFMSKEIHKKESRLRLLQNNNLSTQMVSFVTEIKLLFHYRIAWYFVLFVL